ncbi:MAG: diaminohydroxyphosphoribosylaminopyrimidine deaminase / 5-amino-6-(5-phosphoribosylamino)uracil reductase [Parcubacteria group bacterium Gr01-1014_31]|nr:MAG: diaminohydroxyphosphoribosylaminopyrimidine deaminase / 5-amino-6-(5-phosphoribosylamino)uracil reductase [Parcubacteria group bacterium Gr01-1014_31]
MGRCLLLARRGLGWVSPNPLVGAVIARGRTVIADGFHEKLGGAHAEAAAFTRAKTPVRGATLYVNLEPCDHQGRTPPCTDAIIAAGIKRVVVGMVDPNPKVSGRGIAKLRQAGIRVTVGVREAECRALNRIFIHWITTGTPYIAAKIAIGSDWKIAAAPGVRTHITGEEAQRKAHELRQTHDAILVGAGTVITDDPALTVRHYPERPRDPRRIILDSTLKLPLGSKALADQNVLVATTQDADPAVLAGLRQSGIPVLVTDRQEGRVNVAEVLTWCAQHEISSLLVEGGREVLDSFTRAGLIRRWYIFVASRPLGHTGVDALTDLVPLHRCLDRTNPQFFGPDALYECDAQ